MTQASRTAIASPRTEVGEEAVLTMAAMTRFSRLQQFNQSPLLQLTSRYQEHDH